MQAIGQVSETNFIHRIYEESHVRFQLVSFSDPADPDVIVGTAVDMRFGDPKVDSCRYEAQVFGKSPEQFSHASDAFQQRVTDYIATGKL